MPTISRSEVLLAIARQMQLHECQRPGGLQPTAKSSCSSWKWWRVRDSNGIFLMISLTKSMRDQGIVGFRWKPWVFPRFDLPWKLDVAILHDCIPNMLFAIDTVCEHASCMLSKLSPFARNQCLFENVQWIMSQFITDQFSSKWSGSETGHDQAENPGFRRRHWCFWSIESLACW